MRISHIKMATSTCIEDVMVIQKLCVNDHSKYAALILCTNMDKCINNLRDVALSGRLPCCILDATMVYSGFQALVAANRAVCNNLNNQMVTKSVFNEVIYCLSPSTNISESLRTFGVKKDSKSVLILLINNTGNFIDELKLLSEHVDLSGKVMSVNELINLVDTEKLKHIYGIKEEELKISSLENALLTAMAVKSIT